MKKCLSNKLRVMTKEEIKSELSKNKRISPPIEKLNIQENDNKLQYSTESRVCKNEIKYDRNEVKYDRNEVNISENESLEKKPKYA